MMLDEIVKIIQCWCGFCNNFAPNFAKLMEKGKAFKTIHFNHLRTFCQYLLNTLKCGIYILDYCHSSIQKAIERISRYNILGPKIQKFDSVAERLRRLTRILFALSVALPAQVRILLLSS